MRRARRRVGERVIYAAVASKSFFWWSSAKQGEPASLRDMENKAFKNS
jgi:hypothetical protein